MPDFGYVPLQLGPTPDEMTWRRISVRSPGRIIQDLPKPKYPKAAGPRTLMAVPGNLEESRELVASRSLSKGENENMVESESDESVDGSSIDEILADKNVWSAQDHKEIYEDVTNMNTTLAGLSAIILVFVFSSNAEVINLDSNKVCHGFQEFRRLRARARSSGGSASDSAESAECHFCTNIWKDCVIAAEVIDVYKMLCYVCGVLCVLACLAASGVISHLAHLPTRLAKEYAQDSYWVLSMSGIFTWLAVFVFVICMVIQMSLVLPKVHFIAALVVCGVIAAVFAVIRLLEYRLREKYVKRALLEQLRDASNQSEDAAN